MTQNISSYKSHSKRLRSGGHNSCALSGYQLQVVTILKRAHVNAKTGKSTIAVRVGIGQILGHRPLTAHTDAGQSSRKPRRKHRDRATLTTELAGGF
jgi:hypothetical protein